MGSSCSQRKPFNQYRPKHRSCSAPNSHTMCHAIARLNSDDSSEDPEGDSPNSTLKGHITFLPGDKRRNCFVIEFHKQKPTSNPSINLLNFTSYSKPRASSPPYSKIRSYNSPSNTLINSNSLKGSDCLKTQETKNSTNLNECTNDANKAAKVSGNMLTTLYPIKEVPDDTNSQRCSSTYRSICEPHDAELTKLKKISKGINGCNRMISLSKQNNK